MAEANSPVVVSAENVHRHLPYPALIAALADMFSDGVIVPRRHHHTIERQPGSASTLLLMPAWLSPDDMATGHGFAGVKIVTVSPDNNLTGKPAVNGIYLLMHGVSTEPLALIDGQALTLRRTAAASALAARFLARREASHLCLLGAGKLAPCLARAHASVRPIRKITIWNRTADHAERLADTLRRDGFAVSVASTPEAAIRHGDIVSAATLSSVPLIRAAWIRPGTHLDLVGAFTPQMRESDDATVVAARLFVDTYDGALSEGGDLVQPMQAGLIQRSDILADLAELCRGTHSGRISDSEITLFKSTGTAIEDLAAARLVYQSLQDERASGTNSEA